MKLRDTQFVNCDVCKIIPAICVLNAGSARVVTGWKDRLAMIYYDAQIKSVTRIVRSVLESPSILQNADFSPRTIKELISQGESKTMEKLSYCQSINYDFNKK